MSLQENLELGLSLPPPRQRTPRSPNAKAKETPFPEQLADFKDFGKVTSLTQTVVSAPAGETVEIPTYVNEFWTSRQRAASSLHEISYRACFKPQLPRFFIERLTDPGDIVFDPFMGRGTTPLEAALLGRRPGGSDVNPLSGILTRPRLNPPELAEVARRLGQVDLSKADHPPGELLAFYSPETLREICALRAYLLERQNHAENDAIDDWIRMVAINRLTGHSRGFFSVYTMPPNQAVSVKSQIKINQRRGQIPPRRNVVEIILKKSRQLLKDCDAAARRCLAEVSRGANLLTAPSAHLPEIASGSVALVVTSPPFLNVVDYATDNWLRCWFIGIDPATVQLTLSSKLAAWQSAMTDGLHEMRRILRPGGHVAFEVGEIRKGELKLEQTVVPCGIAAGLQPLLIVINDQQFTKTANCWGVDNNSKGTNSNRIVVFRKD